MVNHHLFVLSRTSCSDSYKKKLKKKDTLASFNLHNYVLLKKEKGLDHCCYYRTTSSVRKAYLRSCLLKHNNVLVVAAGPGENETASWTHSKENLSAEDIDRSVVSCRPVGLYLAVSLVKECIYIVGEPEHTMARVALVDTAINPELQS